MHLRAILCAWCLVGLLLPSVARAQQQIAPREPSVHSPENQVFQFSVSGTCSDWPDGSTSKGTLYLWVPENVAKLSGLIIMGTNVPEHMLVGHPAIRQACIDNNLGLVWSVHTFWNFAKVAKGHDDIQVAFLQKLLDQLAETSGYKEISTIPWLPMGESGHLLMVCGLIDQQPQRVIAGICIKNPHNPKNRTVPMLWTLGTGQEWGQMKGDIRLSWREAKGYQGWVKARAETGWPLSVIVEPGTGHFHCTDEMAEYFAAYISAVCKARLSDDGSATLKPVDLNGGVLAHLPVPEAADTRLLPFAEAQAADLERPWFFSEELAKRAQAFAAIDWTAQTQMPAFVDIDGAGVGVEVTPYSLNSVTQINVQTDGVFEIGTQLLEKIPEGFVGSGEPLAKTAASPRIDWLCGPISPIDSPEASSGKQRFRVALDRTWKAGGATYLAAFIPAGQEAGGSRSVSTAVQPANVKLLENKQGQDQTIAFEAIGDVHLGTEWIDIRASSSSGLPVDFFVVYGPAVVRGNRLYINSAPKHAKYPIEIKVSAWQWGSHQEPLVKTAPVVSQTFYLVKD